MNLFPKFPVFRKLNIDDRERYNEFYSRFDPYSDFSFNNLLVWLDINNDLQISEDNGNLILCFTNPFNKQDGISYTMIGRNHCAESLIKIFDRQLSLGEKQRIVMVPEVVINNLDKRSQKFVIVEDLDNRDYIYKISDISSKKGKKFSNLRYKVNNFTRNHPNNVDVKDIDIKDYSMRISIINNMHIWRSEMEITKNDKVGIEGIAIDRYLRISDPATQCIGIYIDGQLESFSLFLLPPQKNWAIGNHIKCNGNLKNIFDFTYFSTVNRLKSMGIELLNGEQDLGIDGLKVHKLELSPEMFLRRYTIILNR